MYDPSIGRWLNEDPIGFEAGDPNLYRYVGNSPTNATDPTGTIVWMLNATNLGDVSDSSVFEEQFRKNEANINTLIRRLKAITDDDFRKVQKAGRDNEERLPTIFASSIGKIYTERYGAEKGQQLLRERCGVFFDGESLNNESDINRTEYIGLLERELASEQRYTHPLYQVQKEHHNFRQTAKPTDSDLVDWLNSTLKTSNAIGTKPYDYAIIRGHGNTQGQFILNDMLTPQQKEQLEKDNERIATAGGTYHTIEQDAEGNPYESKYIPFNKVSGNLNSNWFNTKNWSINFIFTACYRTAFNGEGKLVVPKENLPDYMETFSIRAGFGNVLVAGKEFDGKTNRSRHLINFYPIKPILEIGANMAGPSTYLNVYQGGQ